MNDQPFSRSALDLVGKAAIVTGGAGILGAHFCSGLAECGADVAVVDLDAARAEALAASLRERWGRRAIGIGCDITRPEAVQQMVASTVEAFGGIDILHNNAATKSADLEAFFAAFEDYDLAMWRSIMAVNIDGMFLVAQAVGRQMIKQGRGGSVIQTASIYGAMAPDQRIYEGSEYLGRPINTPAVYSVSKAAVLGLTRYLSTYWAAHGIRVNSITPGGVRSGQNEEFKRRYSQRVPLGRMAEAGEMVGALVFLASPASSYITGQNLIVDGGLSVW
ncbi:MAG: SDR family oxidoreductase [Planctomycetes bacterium]|nr:SDR family oxidoreductase [Planctomycetota bacterium]